MLHRDKAPARQEVFHLRKSWRLRADRSPRIWTEGPQETFRRWRRPPKTAHAESPPPITFAQDCSGSRLNGIECRYRLEFRTACDELPALVLCELPRFQRAKHGNVARLQPPSHVRGYRNEVHASASEALKDGACQVYGTGVHAEQDVASGRHLCQGCGHLSNDADQDRGRQP